MLCKAVDVKRAGEFVLGVHLLHLCVHLRPICNTCVCVMTIQGVHVVDSVQGVRMKEEALATLADRRGLVQGNERK